VCVCLSLCVWVCPPPSVLFGNSTNPDPNCTHPKQKVERRVLQAIETEFNKTAEGWEEVLFDAGAATNRTIVNAWARHGPPLALSLSSAGSLSVLRWPFLCPLPATLMTSHTTLLSRHTAAECRLHSNHELCHHTDGDTHNSSQQAHCGRDHCHRPTGRGKQSRRLLLHGCCTVPGFRQKFTTQVVP
jgi:hypothetical protein